MKNVVEPDTMSEGADDSDGAVVNDGVVVEVDVDALMEQLQQRRPDPPSRAELLLLQQGDVESSSPERDNDPSTQQDEALAKKIQEEELKPSERDEALARQMQEEELKPFYQNLDSKKKMRIKESDRATVVVPGAVLATDAYKSAASPSVLNARQQHKGRKYVTDPLFESNIQISGQEDVTDTTGMDEIGEGPSSPPLTPVLVANLVPEDPSSLTPDQQTINADVQIAPLLDAQFLTPAHKRLLRFMVGGSILVLCLFVVVVLVVMLKEGSSSDVIVQPANITIAPTFSASPTTTSPATTCPTTGSLFTASPTSPTTTSHATTRPTTGRLTTASPTTVSTTTTSPATGSTTNSSSTTTSPTMTSPTTASPTPTSPTTGIPTTASPTTVSPTTTTPTTGSPTTTSPTTTSHTTTSPTTTCPTTGSPTTLSPTTEAPTSENPTTASPTTDSPTTPSPTTKTPTSAPTQSPTKPQTPSPSTTPTNAPTRSPTKPPTPRPTTTPTSTPTQLPTNPPTPRPTTRPPSPEPTNSPTQRFPLDPNAGNNGTPEGAFPLQICQADCDSDGDCADGLVCLQRSEPQDPIPDYCTGEPQGSEDYCVLQGPPTPKPTLGPTRQLECDGEELQFEMIDDEYNDYSEYWLYATTDTVRVRDGVKTTWNRCGELLQDKSTEQCLTVFCCGDKTTSRQEDVKLAPCDPDNRSQKWELKKNYHVGTVYHIQIINGVQTQFLESGPGGYYYQIFNDREDCCIGVDVLHGTTSGRGQDVDCLHDCDTDDIEQLWTLHD